MITAILLLAVHTFIVVNAQAEASLAASSGLRAAWRAAAGSDMSYAAETVSGVFATPECELSFSRDECQDNLAAMDGVRQGEATKMAASASAAVERVAGSEDGWRWWTDGAARTFSDWCSPSWTDVPGEAETGWVRVVVSGEVVGPLSWILPGRLDTVYAVAEGPALLRAPSPARATAGESVPAAWSRADLPEC